MNKNASLLIARNIGRFIHDYMPSLRTESENTLRSYKTSLELYLQFLETEKGITAKTLSPDCFSVAIIELWVAWLHDTRNCSDGSCIVRLAAVRMFLRFLAKEEKTFAYLYEDSCSVDIRKPRKKKIEGLSKHAIKTILAVIDTTTPIGRRDLCLLVVLYSLALRIDEALSLTIGNLHIDDRIPYAAITGKGGKFRTVYIPKKAVAHLKRFIEEFHGKDPASQRILFFSRNSDGYGKLSQPAVAKRLRLLAEQANKACDEVPLTLHAHQFRHARATHWLEEGVNIVQLSRLLGHSSINTTMVYLDITSEQVATALSKLEDENDKSIAPKWKKNTDLATLCGLKP